MSGLKENWFDKDSVEKTLKNMIEAADLPYLKRVSPDAFERQLITEVETTSPYRGREQTEVKSYIHQHLGELYRYAQDLAAKQTRVD